MAAFFLKRKISMENEKTQAIIDTFEPKRLAARQKCQRFNIVGSVLLFVGFVLLLLGLSLHEGLLQVFVLLGFLLLIAAIVVFSISGYSKDKFQKALSAEVEVEINKALFPNALINPSIGVNYKSIMAPGFFAPPDRYIGNDLRTADYHGISFEQCHYRLQQMQTSNNGRGGTTVSYQDYAVGVMYHFSFERDFGQIVKVLEKQGTLSFNMGNLKKVETEYIEFNRKFLILASDETTCFFLLTPQIQEKIMVFEKLFKGQFYLAFIGHDLYIAANNSDGSAVVPWKEPLTVENMQPVIESMAIPAVFIDLLGLSSSKFEKNGGTDLNKPS